MPTKTPMPWWLRALIVSVIATALWIGAGFYFTEVALKGRLTPQQDQAISETVGQATGITFVGTWVLCFVFRKKR